MRNLLLALAASAVLLPATELPEAEISLEISAGTQEKWTYRYTFGEVPPTP